MSLSDEELMALDNVDPRSQPIDTLGIMDRATQFDPDKSAQVVDIANRRQVPQPVVESELDEFKRRERVEAIDPSTFGPELTKFLSNHDNAAIAQDDIDNLRDIETELAPGSVGRQVQDIGENLKGIASSFASGIPTLTGGAYGVLENATDIIRFVSGQVLPEGMDPLKPMSELFEKGRVGGEYWAERLLAKSDVPEIQAMYSGLQSAGANMAALGGAAITRNAYHALGIMVGAAEGRAYGEAKTQGMGPGSATVYAVTDAGIEYATERMPAFRLIDDLGLNTSLGKTLAHQMIAELPGEQIATVLQDFNSWAFLPDNRDLTFNDYIGERPSAALSTLISTIVGTSVQTGITYGVSKMAGTGDAESDAVARNAELLLNSTDGQQRLDNLITLAQSSKTNERAQDQFKEFLAGAGSEQNVYVPADIVETLETIPPYMAEQIDGLGGDVVIPMDTFMAEVAIDDEMMKILRPHLKMGEDQLSSSEIETGGDVTVRALLERAQASADIKNEADAIWETVKEQLKATGRVTETEARLSAQLFPAYATVTAERYGITPSEVFERMGFRVIGPAEVPVEGRVLTQEVIKTTFTKGSDLLRKAEFINNRDNLSKIPATDEAESLQESYINYIDDPIAQKEADSLGITLSELEDVYEKDITKAVDDESMDVKYLIKTTGEMTGGFNRFLEAASRMPSEVAFQAKKLARIPEPPIVKEAPLEDRAAVQLQKRRDMIAQLKECLSK